MSDHLISAIRIHHLMTMLPPFLRTEGEQLEKIHESLGRRNFKLAESIEHDLQSHHDVFDAEKVFIDFGTAIRGDLYNIRLFYGSHLSDPVATLRNVSGKSNAFWINRMRDAFESGSIFSGQIIPQIRNRTDAELVLALENALYGIEPVFEILPERRLSSASAVCAAGIMYGYLSGQPFRAMEAHAKRLMLQIGVALSGFGAEYEEHLTMQNIQFLTDAMHAINSGIENGQVLQEVNEHHGVVRRDFMSEHEFSKLVDNQEENGVWHNIPTGQFPYTMTYVNLEKREVITYSEGDVKHITHTNDECLRDELLDSIMFYATKTDANMHGLDDAIRNFVPDAINALGLNSEPSAH